MIDIDVVVLSEPSGNIIGILTAHLALGGDKFRRVGHAYIFIDKAPDVAVSAPPKLSFEGLARFNSLMQRFECELARLVAAYGPRDVVLESSREAGLRRAAEVLVRHHLDGVDVHPCDTHDDAVRAKQCISEVQSLRDSLLR